MTVEYIYNRTRRLLAVLVMLMTALPAAAIDRATEERLQNIERKLDSRGLVDMLNRLEQMQRDLQKMRGELEQQTHRLDGIERRQREQYVDIDRRLQELETRSSGVVAPIPGTDAGSAVVTPPPSQTATPKTPPPAIVASGDTAEGKAEYETALAILRDGRYADAALAFKQFLARHPGSSMADNASYWLGETYYVTRDFDQSLATFTGLVNNHPQSPKVSDSRLKIGYIHYEKKDWKAARAELEAVVGNYPGTTAARLANDRLARMKKEGR